MVIGSYFVRPGDLWLELGSPPSRCSTISVVRLSALTLLTPATYPFALTTEMVEHREGGDPSSSHKSPGRTKYEPITMERGVTHDLEFEQWANKVWNFGNAQAPADQREKEVSLKDFRRNLTIDVFNEAGQKVISYKVYRAWVSEFTAQADLDANANAILIQSIKIEHEGWERDVSVKEPVESQFEDVGV